MQLRFVSWAAVSSARQADEDKDSLANQQRTNREHIEKWGGVLVEELTVKESRSITTLDLAAQTIKAYADLRSLIARRAFDVLVYLDRSRLGRKASLSMTIVELCNEAGIITYATESPPSVLEKGFSNFANSVMGAIESVLAQEEVIKIQARHQLGMAHRVRSGNFPGAPPYGWTLRYEIVDGKPTPIVEVDEEASEAIGLFVELYTRKRRGLSAIASELAAKGYRPPRGEWTRGTLQSILNMVWRYAGRMELNRHSKRKRPYVTGQSKWPTLITEDVAKAVEAERKRRQSAKRAVGSSHRFSQLVYCAQCEIKMQAAYGMASGRGTVPKYPYEVFRCLDKNSRASHKRYSITAKPIEAALRKAIEFVQSEANRAALLGPNEGLANSIRRQIEKATMRLARHEEATQRADDAYVAGTMSVERYQRQVDKLDEQGIKIQEELARYNEELEFALYDERRGERLLEIASNGMAALVADDVAAANAWFLRHFRISIDNDATDEEYRVLVDYL